MKLSQRRQGNSSSHSVERVKQVLWVKSLVQSDKIVKSLHSEFLTPNTPTSGLHHGPNKSASMELGSLGPSDWHTLVKGFNNESTIQ